MRELTILILSVSMVLGLGLLIGGENLIKLEVSLILLTIVYLFLKNINSKFSE